MCIIFCINIYLCVVGVDRAFFVAIQFLLCSVGLGPAVFEMCVMRGTRVECYPLCHLPLPSEWCGGFEASCKGRLEDNEFFWELVTWGHSLFLQYIATKKFISNDPVTHGSVHSLDFLSIHPLMFLSWRHPDGSLGPHGDERSPTPLR